MDARRPVAVITDSTACLPEAIATELEIEVVPVTITIDGKQHADRDDLGQRLDQLLVGRARATTSAPAPGVYLAAMRRSLQQGRSVLCITVAQRFSAMRQSAEDAAVLLRREVPGVEIEILDSQNSAMAQGFVAIAAARRALQGGNLEQCREAAARAIASSHLVFAIDDLSYLARSGRVPHLVAWAAGLLQVKPIVHSHSGGEHLLDRVRTMKRALERLPSAAAGIIASAGGELHFAVQHGDMPEQAADLAESIQARFRPASLTITPFTPAILVHTGPRLVGVAFYRDATAVGPVHPPGVPARFANPPGGKGRASRSGGEVEGRAWGSLPSRRGMR
ncbi:MAG: DegV family protein [Dehalococcoidia bacterium]